jgi:hypothetical protein
MAPMRGVCAVLLAVLTGCATVQTGRDFVGTQKTPPRCGLPSFVVTASQLEYPKVLLDVVEEADCNVEITDTYVVHSEIRPPTAAFSAGAATIGGLAGIGAWLALRSSSPTPLPVVSSAGAYRTTYSGDAAIILPFVGALAGLGAYFILGHGEHPVQTLPDERELEQRLEPRPLHTAIVDGALRLKDGTGVAPLRGGQAVVDLSVAARAFRDGLWLDDHALEWSVRAGWTPHRSPACARAQDAMAPNSGIEKAPKAAVVRATNDAAVCYAQGWPGAMDTWDQLEILCKRRFDSACESTTK